MNERRQDRRAAGQEPPPGGIECRDCGCPDLRVWMTRKRPSYVLRVRVCTHCGRKMTTRERAV